jgi:hypothetical protein
MTEHRREERYSSYAKAVLVSQNNLGYLRDMNKSGCQVDFIDPPNLNKDSVVEITVIPNEELGIDNFNLLLTVKWMRQDQVYYSIGGVHAIITDGDREAFDKLLGYFSK